MAFCGNCGSKFEDGTKFCPSCGAPAQAGQPTQTQQAAYQATIVPAAPVSPAQDAQDNKAMAILAYIIFLIPLLAAKDSKFARYHTNQGLLVVLLSIAWGVVYSILIAILTAISWRVGLAATTILGIVSLVIPVLCVIGIVNACKGEMKPLPLIGKITLLK